MKIKPSIVFSNECRSVRSEIFILKIEKNVVQMTTNPLYLMLSTIENAAVAELVDALDLKSNWYLNASAGSSPARGTGLFIFTDGEAFLYASRCHNSLKINP